MGRARPLRVVAGLVASAALALAGCGGGGDGRAETVPDPEPGTGYFVGSGSGVGAALDLHARDPVASELRRSLDASGRVAVVAVVNERDTVLPAPGFRAVLVDDRTVVLASARERPRRVPARSARTIYLAVPSELAEGGMVAVEMTVAGRTIAMLRQRAR